MSDILLIHAAVTLPLGGASGVLSYELLDSAAHRPFATFDKEFLYQTGLEQSAALLESLVLNHAFEDGNKRTALVSCFVFPGSLRLLAKRSLPVRQRGTRVGGANVVACQ
jgi:death-on-curing protein